MFQPKIPTMPQPTGLVTPPAVVEPATVTPAAHTPQLAPAAAPVLSRPAVQLTPGTALALVGGGTAVVLVVGAVLVSMLLAVAVTATSTAICAVVIRSLLTRR
ncbi:SpdD-like protein [Streptomyces europaeiscabiei]|uniref:SpdD-like protein n=1 Tax=Streptomyces europaeiscabiei TaxID=146819 RepID=UPI0029A8E983|nr:SpdD-like protein [Streptomyces europaeiscabiei]MDX3697207.1 SpdD-like protein [Streptomyces europaeiscabiei]